jgi:hypothetical protein
MGISAHLFPKDNGRRQQNALQAEGKRQAAGSQRPPQVVTLRAAVFHFLKLSQPHRTLRMGDTQSAQQDDQCEEWKSIVGLEFGRPQWNFHFRNRDPFCKLDLGAEVEFPLGKIHSMHWIAF